MIAATKAGGDLMGCFRRQPFLVAFIRFRRKCVLKVAYEQARTNEPTVICSCSCQSNEVSPERKVNIFNLKQYFKLSVCKTMTTLFLEELKV